jgi:hypothetical protein
MDNDETPEQTHEKMLYTFFNTLMSNLGTTCDDFSDGRDAVKNQHVDGESRFYY